MNRHHIDHSNGEILTPMAIKKLSEHLEASCRWVCIEGRWYSPGELAENCEKLLITNETIRIVDPRQVIKNGRLKLYEIMLKQLRFEKKVEDYIAGKYK